MTSLESATSQSAGGEQLIRYRRRLTFGYIFTPEVLFKWAEKATGRQYNTVEKNAFRKALFSMRKVAKRHGTVVEVIGEGRDFRILELLVLTEHRFFADGRVGYPVEQLPQKEEGVRELRTRQILIDEGLDPKDLHYGRRLTGESQTAALDFDLDY
ncbi:hypothetical protein BDZ89DRAFT_781859 [Hymenopellis radicata]|nr:hypothetical protein BDZ89DRAFT_781859 [Hymenopellis radicata]